MHMDAVQGGGYSITIIHSSQSIHTEYQESSLVNMNHIMLIYNFNE